MTRAPSLETSARTMSKHFYLDADVYEREKDRIFYAYWQCVGHVSDLPSLGSYFVTDVGEESLLVCRTSVSEVQTYYNVCQHRAHLLAEGAGQCERFVCPYHGWTYGIDGRLLGARGTRLTGDEIQLKKVRTHIMCGLIFVVLDQAAPEFDTQFPTLEKELKKASPKLADMHKVANHVWRHEANWKVSVENFSECYHCPVVHKYLVANTYSAEDYRIDFEGLTIRHQTKGRRDPKVHGSHLLIWFLWPNLAIEVYPLHRSVSIRHFRIRGPMVTDYVYEWYVDPALGEQAVKDVVEYAKVHHETTGDEDHKIVSAVQRGLSSRGYIDGPFVMTESPSNESENAVAHVQRLYLQAMGVL